MDPTYAMEIADSMRFHEEIRSLMGDANVCAAAGSSFTALLGLAPQEAAEVLAAAPPTLDRGIVKSEPVELDDAEEIGSAAPRQPVGKRKGPEKKMKSGGTKKNKSRDEGREDGDAKRGDGDSEKPSYVHVRARRGQATDSHSLAERARREKINARMKLLQELVPGCSKISGTALVLDEIINHVQSLQRQVEFLSMKLAAVDPNIDFCGLDSFLDAESSRLTACSSATAAGIESPLWVEVPMDGLTRHHHQQQQIWQADMVPPHLSSVYERSDNYHYRQRNDFIGSGPSSLFSFDPTSVAMSANQLKMEEEF